MNYKYQSLIDEHELVDCPATDLREINDIFYRWVHNPIGHSLNFLPIFIYDKMRGQPSRRLDKNGACLCCGLSFFDDENVALYRLRKIIDGLESKHKKLVFYTHVARGELNSSHGKGSDISKHHLTFYEYEGVNLSTEFIISSEI